VSGASAAAPQWKSRDAIDALCLAAITVASSLPYLRQLGFYSDDWGLLADFSADRSGFLALAVNNFPGRPVQGLYLVTLFRFFGLDPLGYHVVNTAVLAASAALLYLLLQRLRLGRAESFATTLLFVMLPQLSTVRVWYAAFQIPLSLALMLLSIHCQLSFRQSGGLGWLGGAIGAALLSIASYEIFAPLLAGFAVALLFERWRSGSRDRWAILIALCIIALVLAVFLYKLASGRAGAIGDPRRYLLGLHQLVRTDYDWRLDSGLNLMAMLQAYFAAPLWGWWRGVETLVTGQSGSAVAVIGAFVAIVAWWRLRSEKPLGSRRLLLLGIATFLLGHATFLIVPSIAFTSTGMGNRVQVAAAIGVAMILVSLVAFAGNLLPRQLRDSAFAAVIAIVAVAAFARLAAIERYWAEAPALQERVRSAARADLSNVPAGSTVILDGVCPYHGPAVVFEAGWDVGGALSLALSRQIAGEAVSPRMHARASGLEASIYRERSFYPYGPRLFVYNPVSHLLLRLDDAATATQYFSTRRAAPCPGFVARGAEV
jgi:hypothetical protein